MATGKTARAARRTIIVIETRPITWSSEIGPIMLLTHSPRPVLVLIAPVLFLAIIHFAAADPSCNDTANGSSFHLVAVHETALEEQSATR